MVKVSRTDTVSDVVKKKKLKPDKF